MPVSTRVHEAGVVSRLIGRLETEIVEAVYANVDETRHCPTQTNTQQLNCTITSSSASQLLLPNCSHQTTSENFGRTTASAESLPSVATVTDDAISQLMREKAVWYKLSEESRRFLRSVRPLHAADIINSSISVFLAHRSAVVDKMTSLLPLSSRDVTLLDVSASVSGLLALAFAQRAIASQCLLGHVFYTCGHLAAVERFYFRSNWSRVESELRDIRYCYSDSTTEQLYADIVECPQSVLATMSTSVVQSHGCTTADDVIRWYSACAEMLNGTSRLMETMIGRTEQTVAGAWRCCLWHIVMYSLLICLQVCLLCNYYWPA